MGRNIIHKGESLSLQQRTEIWNLGQVQTAKTKFCWLHQHARIQEGHVEEEKEVVQSNIFVWLCVNPLNPLRIKASLK